MSRWQWRQWLPLGAYRHNTAWFHRWSSPRCCGKPVTLHLGNPFNSWFTFCHFSLVKIHSTQNMIFNCTSKGNSLPNGLSSRSTSPWYFMVTAPSMQMTSPLCSTLLVPNPGPITSSRQAFFFMDEKVYPWGVPPIMSFRPRHPHVMPLHQSGSQEDSLKHVASRMRWLVWPNSSRGITPFPARFIMKSIVAKWLARRVAFFIDRTGSLPSLIPCFFLVCRGVSRSRLSSARPLAHPPLPFPSTISTELGSAFLGPKLFVLIFLYQIP